MLRTRHLLAVFIPVFLILGAIFFVRIIQYQPLFPKRNTKIEEQKTSFHIPIFSDDPIIGDRQAPTTLIVFSDLGCIHCAKQFAMWEELQKQYPKKFKIIWKALPVVKFPYSTELANAYAYCANAQGKFINFVRLAFQNDDNLSPTVVEALSKAVEIDTTKIKSCQDSGNDKLYLQKVEQLATLLNIQAVPTIFLNDKQIEPPLILEGWKTLLGL